MGPTYKCRIRQDRKRANGTFTIYLSIQWDRATRRDINLGVDVIESQFDAEKGRLKRTHVHANDFNLVLADAESRANQILIEYRLQRKEVTPAQFMEEWNFPERKNDFLAWYQSEMNRRWSRGIISDSTRVTDMTVLKKLQKFQAVNNRKKGWSEMTPITFQDIDKSWLEAFDLWHLGDLKARQGKRLTKNGAAPRWTATKKIKTYLHLAEVTLGIQLNPTIGAFKSKRPDDQKCPLSPMQFKRLRVLYNKGELPFEDQQVLRAFIFACFTGLRYSDAERITYDQISANTLSFQAHKTIRVKHEIISLPLPEQAIEMLEPNRTGGTVLNLKSNQRSNLLLKRIAEEAGMKGVRLTFKWSRDTFATTFLQLGGAVEVLQRFMGHSKITDTMKYVTITEERKQQSQKIWKDLESV
ncbi:MAG TPA: tyrosine-type recombinase/integrase [Bacteroidia bacterium]|nr:tyrosine-type recombinase/integrase [Bacteroidia bacterium]